MSKFDTHGGHFAPVGYMRVDAGGSHEENPNGGVQVGVDSNGVPNLLEEGEPVYKDFVYSDNIRMDADMAKAHYIPTKYVGKLYSEIADAYIDEAAEMTIDPISNNGLNEMLVRLAEAQEEQKQIAEQKELEEELADMSPEELAQLEQMLAQQEQGEAVPQEAMVPQEIAPEQIAPEQIVQQPMMEQPVVMGCGGSLKKNVYSLGTDGLEIVDGSQNYAVRDNTATRFVPGVGFITNVPTQEELEAELALRQARQEEVDAAVDRLLNGPDNVIEGNGALELVSAAVGKGIANIARAKSAASGRFGKISKSVKTGLKNLSAKGKNYAESLGKQASNAKTAASEMRNISGYAGEEIARTKGTIKNLSQKAANTKPKNIKTGYERQINAEAEKLVGQTAEKVKADVKSLGNNAKYAGLKVGQGLASGASSAAETLAKVKIPKWVWGVGGTAAGAIGIGAASGIVKGEKGSTNQQNPNDKDFGDLNSNSNKKALGGNIYENGTGGLDRNNGYSYYDTLGMYGTPAYLYYPNRNPGTVAVSTPPAISLGKVSSMFTPQFGVGAYFNRKPLGVVSTAPGGIWTGYTAGNPTVSTEIGSGTIGATRYSGNGSVGKGNTTTKSSTRVVPDSIKDPLPAGPEIAMPTGASVLSSPKLAPKVTSQIEDTIGDDVAINSGGGLPVWPRYAGIGVAAASLLNNLAQPEDNFVAPNIDVSLPYATMHTVPQEYRAIDPNLATNTLLAQGNATQRAIRNSGAGPSTMAGLVASDYNLNNALGNAFVQGWSDANMRRNAVIGANNATEAQRASFDFQVMKARADALNQASQLRARYDMLAQQLNQTTDMQEAQAISSQLDAIAEALSNIGRENFVINQLNSNRGLLYGQGQDGSSFYKLLLENV